MDKITRVQEQISYISLLMFNSLGTLQRDAPPLHTAAAAAAGAGDHDQQKQQQHQQQEDADVSSDFSSIRSQATDMGREIVRASVELDAMLDELPGVHSSEREQLQQIAELEKRNEEQAEALAERVRQAETLLESVSGALDVMARDRAFVTPHQGDRAIQGGEG